MFGSVDTNPISTKALRGQPTTSPAKLSRCTATAEQEKVKLCSQLSEAREAEIGTRQGDDESFHEEAQRARRPTEV